MSMEEFSRSTSALEVAFHGESQYNHFPCVFYPFYFKRGEMGEERKIEQMPSAKMHTPSLIIIDLPCNPMLACVTGPCEYVRDVHPATLGSGVQAYLVSCIILMLPGTLQKAETCCCEKATVRWALCVGPGRKSKKERPSSSLSIFSIDLFGVF